MQHTFWSKKCPCRLQFAFGYRILVFEVRGASAFVWGCMRDGVGLWLCLFEGREGRACEVGDQRSPSTGKESNYT